MRTDDSPPARPARALVLLLAAMTACGGASTSPPPPASAWPSPACFQGGEVPQLDLDGPVAGWTFNDPHVLRVGSEYWMYASATDSFDFPVRLYRLVSTDGEAWTLDPPGPILEDAAPGRWDAGGMETPAVVFHGGQYHLFYTAYPVEVDQAGHRALDYRVGHAVSSDGETFVRVGDAPLVETSGTSDADPSNDWYAFVVAEPGPVARGGALSVYFTALGADAGLGTSLQVIGVVTSEDGGVTWTAPALALAPDQALYPRGEDWIGYSTPNAVVVDGEVHLFFDVAHQPEGGAWRQRRIHHARSADGRTGWIHDAEPILEAPAFGWAVDEVRAPGVLLDGTTLRLYFAGHELDGQAPDHFAVGMMTCER